MRTAEDVLLALAGRYAFGEVAALVDDVEVAALCSFGQRVMDLDAEDFGTADAVPEPLRRRALACRMPQEPDETERGALGSLVPAYRLLLEVVDARWRRREMSALVATLHITSEYLPLLIWEQVLGHAGDPARLPHDVGGPGSFWGDPLAVERCPHSGVERSSAARAVKVASEPGPGWRAYLDRQHSYVSQALAVCAAQCRDPCTVLTRHDPYQQALLSERTKTAVSYADSAIIRLRHFAPVGHGFGVPSPEEVVDAWARTRASLGRHQPAVLADDRFVLTGLPSLFSVLSGATIRPDTLLADTAASLKEALLTGLPG